MKTQLPLWLGLLLITQSIKAQSWIPQGVGLLPYGYEVNSISVVDDSVLWVTSSLREGWSYPVTVFRSTDAGKSWSTHPVSNCSTCKSKNIEAIDDQTAWLTTYDQPGFGILYKTVDGGQTWIRKLEDRSAMGVVQAFDDTHLMCHDHGYFAWSEDGGENWEADIVSATFPGYYPYLLGQASSNENTAWLGMASLSNPSPSVSAQLVRATNYGRDIEFIDTGLDSVYSIWLVSMNDQNHGIMAYTEWIYEYDLYYGMGYYYGSSDERLAISGDDGESWTTIDKPLPHVLSVISVPNTPQAYVVADGQGIAWTSNSGMDWSYHFAPYDISSIDFSSADAGWVAINGSSAIHPLVLKWNGDFTSGVGRDASTHGAAINISPNPANDFIMYSVEDDSQEHRLTLINAAGLVMIKQQTSQRELNISHVPAGVYFLKVEAPGLGGIAKVVKR